MADCIPDAREWYWVITVRHDNGDTVSFGPFLAEQAHEMAGRWRSDKEQTFVVAKR